MIEPDLNPPTAPVRPHLVTSPQGSRSDPYYWLRDDERTNPEVLAYLNRLSDLIWLFGRLIELNAGISARLRDESKAGPKWSRAW